MGSLLDFADGTARRSLASLGIRYGVAALRWQIASLWRFGDPWVALSGGGL
jgi:hypothetical protein